GSVGHTGSAMPTRSVVTTEPAASSRNVATEVTTAQACSQPPRRGDAAARGRGDGLVLVSVSPCLRVSLSRLSRVSSMVVGRDGLAGLAVRAGRLRQVVLL